MIFVIGIIVATNNLRSISKYIDNRRSINGNCIAIAGMGIEQHTLSGNNYGKNTVFKL